MTQAEQTVANAVKELRAHLKESQQDFSNRLGVVVRTIARYELEKPPSGEMLDKFIALANEVGRDDLASIFLIGKINDVIKANEEQRKEQGDRFRFPAQYSWNALQWLTVAGGAKFWAQLDSFLREETARAIQSRRLVFNAVLSEEERAYLGPFAQSAEPDTQKPMGKKQKAESSANVDRSNNSSE